MRLWAAGMQIHSTMKTTSSPWIKTVTILAVLLPLVATWWWSSRHYTHAKNAEAQVVANENAKRWLDEVSQQLAESRVKTDDAARKLAEVKPLLEGAKREQSELDRKRAELLQQMRVKSFEFGAVEPKRRTSWNGQTDPDGLWHDQRRSANQMLIKQGLPTLEGRSAFPDTAPLSRSFQAGPGQK